MKDFLKGFLNVSLSVFLYALLLESTGGAILFSFVFLICSYLISRLNIYNLLLIPVSDTEVRLAGLKFSACPPPFPSLPTPFLKLLARAFATLQYSL